MKLFPLFCFFLTLVLTHQVSSDQDQSVTSDTNIRKLRVKLPNIRRVTDSNKNTNSFTTLSPAASSNTETTENNTYFNGEIDQSNQSGIDDLKPRGANTKSKKDTLEQKGRIGPELPFVDNLDADDKNGRNYRSESNTNKDEEPSNRDQPNYNIVINDDSNPEILVNGVALTNNRTDTPNYSESDVKLSGNSFGNTSANSYTGTNNDSIGNINVANDSPNDDTDQGDISYRNKTNENNKDGLTDVKFSNKDEDVNIVKSYKNEDSKKDSKLQTKNSDINDNYNVNQNNEDKTNKVYDLINNNDSDFVYDPDSDFKINSIEAENFAEIQATVNDYNKVMPGYSGNDQWNLYNRMMDVYNNTKVYFQVRSHADDNKAKEAYWRTLKDLNIHNLTMLDPALGKLIYIIVDKVGYGSLSYIESQELQMSLAKMEDNYRKRSIVPYEDRNKEISYKPRLMIQDIEPILSQNRSNDELKYYWSEWHNTISNQSIENFAIYAHTLNKAAKLQSMKDGSVLLKQPYEDDDLEKNMNELWGKVKPLYDLLKKQVVLKMRKMHGAQNLPGGDQIPAHLLGGISGMQWTPLYENIKPYQCENEERSTEYMNMYDYCTKSLEFSNSMFFDRNYVQCQSVISLYPEPRVADCHPRYYDFSNREFRFSACARNNVDIEMAREFEKMLYAMEHSNLSFALRDAPHPGFKFAVATLFAKQTLKYAQGQIQETPEFDSNQLFLEALDTLPRLPYAMTIQNFRWDIAKGSLPKSEWSDHWWKLRSKYEGVVPPSNSIKGEFDPAGNYDIVMDNDQTPNFLGTIMYFQLLRAACHEGLKSSCNKSSNNDIKRRPLQNCMIYGKRRFGEKLKSIEAQGRAIDWRDAWYNLTGSRDISADAMLEYFEPITEYLHDSNISDEIEAKDKSGWVAIGVGIALLVIILILLIIFIWKYCGKAKPKTDAEAVSVDAAGPGRFNHAAEIEELPKPA